MKNFFNQQKTLNILQFQINLPSEDDKEATQIKNNFNLLSSMKDTLIITLQIDDLCAIFSTRHCFGFKLSIVRILSSATFPKMIYVVKLILTLKAHVITSSRGGGGGWLPHTLTINKNSSKKAPRVGGKASLTSASHTSPIFLLKF